MYLYRKIPVQSNRNLFYFKSLTYSKSICRYKKKIPLTYSLVKFNDFFF